MDRAEQIRRLLISLSKEQLENTSDSTSSRHQRSLALRGSSSSSSKQQAVSDAQASIEERIRYLKSRHGGRFPAFDDRRPDPGCRVEAWRYRQLLHPVPPIDRLSLKDDSEHPQVRQLLEQAREAHWKLTAPKGFAALKGIPELQQLLAYTAADVVHYAAEDADPGLPGRFDDYAKQQSPAIAGFSPSDLHDEHSLIGQLCPGLRLCLAAEVATGLMCDSQPPPPDTPEHASALLLFLAAAHKQVEQELNPAARDGLCWLQCHEQYPAAMRALLDFCLCPQPTELLGRLQELARQSAEKRVANSSSSSSSSAADGSMAEPGVTAAAQTDAFHGNVVFAALEVAAFLTGTADSSDGSSGGSSDHSCFTSSSSSSSSSSSGGGSDGRSSSSMWDMLYKLRGRVPRNVEAQQQQGVGEAQPQSTEQGEAQHGYNAAQLVDYVLDLLGEWVGKQTRLMTQELLAQRACDDPEAAAAADADADAAASTASEAAAAAAPACANCADAPKPCKCAMCLSKARLAAAEAAAWPIAVLTGAAALQRVMNHGAAAGTDAGPHSDVPNPVHVALLCSAINGLYHAVLETLSDAGCPIQPSCTCSQCSQLQQQQLQADPDPHLISQLAKAKTVKLILQLLRLGHDLSSGSGDSSSSSSSSSAEPVSGTELQEEQQLAAAAQAIDAITNPHIRQAVQVVCYLKALEGSDVAAPASWLASMFPQQETPLRLLDPSFAATDGQASNASSAAQPQGDTQAESLMRTQRQSLINAHIQLASRPLQEAVDQLADGSNSAPKSPAAEGSDQQQQGASASTASNLVSLIDMGHGKVIAGAMAPFTHWQSCWLRCAHMLNSRAGHRVLTAEDEPAAQQKAAGQRQRLRKGEQHVEVSKESAELQQVLRAAGFCSDSSDGEDAGDAVLTADAAAAAKDRGRAAAPAGDMDTIGGKQGRRGANASNSSSSSKTGGSGKSPECLLCIAEAKAAKVLSECHLSSSNDGGSSSSGGSSSPAAAGLYGSLPVSWSDPFMMRRLLWDLLGKLKPTAQAWFRQYADMCPHKTTSLMWRMVVLSLARHMWAPPGDWSLAEERQMQLLLPEDVRCCHNYEPDDEQQCRAAVVLHARLLNLAFQHHNVEGCVAAVLSRLALLALDPHGARVQPRPELLFFTPAGFHAAVSKTLLQCFQLPPVQAPAALEAAAAAVAAGNRAQASSQEQQQLIEQRPQSHYLQAWSDVLFPAWYMWWHIGLLAYHQQQQLGRAMPARDRGLGTIEDNTQQQQQQQQQQEGGRPQQLGRGIRLVTARSGSTELPGGTDCSSPQTPPALIPPAAPETPALLPPALPAGSAAAAAAQGLGRSQSGPSEGSDPLCSSGSGGKGSSRAHGSNGIDSSSSGAAVPPVDMLELYNSPEARLFAVGYAMRQTSSGQQLIHLMSNPPVPWGLQFLPSEWVLSMPAKAGGTCAFCQDSLSKEAQTVIYTCNRCGAVTCSLECSTEHEAQPSCCHDSVYTVSLNRRWRILDLMYLSSRQQQQQQQPGSNPSPSADFCIPPALNNVLFRAVGQWHTVVLTKYEEQELKLQQQQQEQADSLQQGSDQAAQQQAADAYQPAVLPLFPVYSGMYTMDAELPDGLAAAAAAAARDSSADAPAAAAAEADAADPGAAAAMRQLTYGSKADAMAGYQHFLDQGWDIEVNEDGAICMTKPEAKSSETSNRPEDGSSNGPTQDRQQQQEGRQQQQEGRQQQQEHAQQQQDADQAGEQQGDAALQRKQLGEDRLQQLTLQLQQLTDLSQLVTADPTNAAAAAELRSVLEPTSASTPNLQPGPQRPHPDADSD